MKFLIPLLVFISSSAWSAPAPCVHECDVQIGAVRVEVEKVLQKVEALEMSAARAEARAVDRQPSGVAPSPEMHIYNKICLSIVGIFLLWMFAMGISEAFSL